MVGVQFPLFFFFNVEKLCLCVGQRFLFVVPDHGLKVQAVQTERGQRFLEPLLPREGRAAQGTAALRGKKR